MKEEILEKANKLKYAIDEIKRAISWHREYTLEFIATYKEFRGDHFVDYKAYLPKGVNGEIVEILKERLKMYEEQLKNL